jgi:hypothetical protein
MTPNRSLTCRQLRAKQEKGKKGSKGKGRAPKKEEAKEESKEPKEEDFRFPEHLRLPEGFELPEEEINEGDEELTVPETVSRKRYFFSDISSVSTPPSLSQGEALEGRVNDRRALQPE